MLTDRNVLQCMELKARPPSTHQWTISPAVLLHCHVLPFSKLMNQTDSMPVFDLFLHFINLWGLPVPVKHQWR